MEPSLRIKSNGSQWDLTGNTVVTSMDDTEMLFRIVTMTRDEVIEFASSLSGPELSAICKKIQEHRAEAQAAGVLPPSTEFSSPSPLKYVVQKHISNRGWN